MNIQKQNNFQAIAKYDGDSTAKYLAQFDYLSADFHKKRLQNAKSGAKSFQELTSNKEYFETLNEMLKSIKLPKLDLIHYINFVNDFINLDFKDKHQNKKQAVEKWAEYGWPISSKLGINQIFNPPNSKTEADEMMISLINESEMFEQLEDISGFSFVNREMLKDIKFLFKHRKYNSCISIACNVIDRILIMHMFFDNYYADYKYSINKKDIDKKTSLANSLKKIDLLYTKLSSHNTMILLTRMFEKADTWKHEPDYVVRDFVNHGMSDKKWTKIDAIKTILLLINFAYLSDFVREKEQLDKEFSEISKKSIE